MRYDKSSSVCSSYYSLMRPLMDALYQFFKIHMCVEALAADIKRRFDAVREQWPYVNLKDKLKGKGRRFKEFTLGHKFHSIHAHATD